MTTSAASAGSARPALFNQHESLLARMAGVVVSPRATFDAMARVPRVGAVLLVTFAATWLCTALLLQTEVGQLALVDQWERTALAFGQAIGDAEYAALQDAARNSIAYAAATALASGPGLAAAMAALLWVTFNRGGRSATYRQLLAVTAHAGVILAIRQVIAAPISYGRETLASPTTMSVFFTMLDEASPLARFLGVIDVFIIWWLIVLAVGVSVLYRRPAGGLAVVFASVYLGFAAVLAAIMAVLGGIA